MQLVSILTGQMVERERDEDEYWKAALVLAAVARGGPYGRRPRLDRRESASRSVGRPDTQAGRCTSTCHYIVLIQIVKLFASKAYLMIFKGFLCSNETFHGLLVNKIRLHTYRITLHVNHFSPYLISVQKVFVLSRLRLTLAWEACWYTIRIF